MQIHNLNPERDIGASAWCVSIDGHSILLDAGVHPKHDGLGALPTYKDIRDVDVEAIAISHCHHDHVGSLPVALQYFPQASVYMSELSYFIVERVLHNSVNVMQKQRTELGISEYPLYSHNEVDEIAHHFQGLKYNREISWGMPKKGSKNRIVPTLEFYDAGHALGSAGIMIRGKEQSLFYSGDVCFQDQTILKGARFEDVRADVMILETTRGAKGTPEGVTRATEIERLTKAISRVLARKGSVLIPTFALGRTQEILALLALLMKEGQLKQQPVFIGGLGRVFTEIYDLQAHRAHRQHSNLSLHEELNLVVLEKGQADKMKLGGGRIFVVTAGMMSEHTAAHDLAVRMAGDKRQAIFFVGYADPDTPGGRMKAAPEGEEFFFSNSGGSLVRNCELDEFDLTAHANREELVELVGAVDPQTVILGHGDPDARAWMEDEIRSQFPKVDVLQGEPGERFDV